MTIEQLTQDIEAQGLELVIGLETHIRLSTKTKLFCACPNREEETPNHNICPVCTGQMGVLPAINKEAIRKAIYFGKAVNANVHEKISWDRKHYEYPDLPKNFQTTQYHNPIITSGIVECFREDGTTFSVELEQVHIEEDAAKLIHEKNRSFVDFNKGGSPLIEVVTKPVIQNIKDASIYAQYLQRIAVNLGISEANLEKGQFKSDVSISLRKKGTDVLNPRTEIKNLNSFRFMVEALIEEIGKQLDYYTQHKDFRPDQTTVLWDEELKQTRTMRKKEFDADYRFILEPDLPLVDIKSAIDAIEIDKSLLPYNIETILIFGGVRPQDAKFFTSDILRSKLFVAINEEVGDVLFVTKALMNNLKPEDYVKVTNTKVFSSVFKRYQKKSITQALFQKIIQHLLIDADFDYKTYIKKHTLSPEKLDEIITTVIKENPDTAKAIENGNHNIAGLLVGKIMGQVGKAASGKEVREKIIKMLAKDNSKPESGSTTKKEKGSEKAATKKGQSNFSIGGIDQIIVKENYRTHKITEISTDSLNQEVTLAGWVSSIRDHGDLVFIDLRDTTYRIIQVRLSKDSFSDLESYTSLKPESVISVCGKIIMREESDYNPNLKTGTIELDTTKLEILNIAKTLPFEIRRAAKSNENVRLKYKYLDHRNSKVRKTIIHRHKVIKLIRDILDEQEFLEIETPVLSAGSEEGAREFIVPSRKFAGKFYTLPQAPQQCKQMLMVGGFDKYFQLARCFRDEDMRGDRQPEFTQLDIEMAYVSMQEIMDLNANMFNTIVTKIYGKQWKLFPFKVMTYYEAMEKYGCDRPDLRFGLEMQDITDIVKETSFQVFSKPIEQGGIVKCIKVSGDLTEKRISKKQIERLTKIAQENGLGGLAYIIVNEDELQSPIIKYLGETVAANIIKATKAVVGDIVFFSAADYKTANKALDTVRQELGDMLKLIKPNELHPAWVIDFPLFEETEDGKWTFTHNPFSMPKVEDIQDHIDGKNLDKIISQQYDMVLNGTEIGGGSIRAHKPQILEATYRNMGYNHEEMMSSVGHMYNAFQYGAPPHGGIAWGVDRLMMILEKKTSIREVMAFPKTGSGEDLLFSCPSVLSKKKINDANITSINVIKEDQ